MQKFAITAALLVLSASVRTEEVRRDGNWWNGLNPTTKLAYVTGFFDGLSPGKDFAMPLIDGRNTQVSRQTTLNEITLVTKRFNARMAKYFSPVTNDQLVDGLDEFYKDFKNRSILLGSAVNVVVRQIAGEDVTSLILAYRQFK